MGVMPQAGYARGESFKLEPGDVLLLYTDGVTEARGGEGRRELFGLPRLGAALAEARDGTPEEILRHIRAAVRRFTAHAANDDDVTMVAVKRAPAP